jgi:uncharacterized SAM-binding protein YcdF (DUF218 family)
VWKLVILYVLIPPVCLAFLTLLGLLLQWRYQRLGYVVACIGALSLVVMALPAFAASLLVPLEQNLPLTPPPDDPPQAIVILGGDIQRTSGKVMYPGGQSLARVRAGAALARKTGLPVLITGGKLRPSDRPVGELMATSLQEDFGVPARWVEPVSLDTWENAHMSAPILKEHGIHSIYLVTSAWHMRRALQAFADTGIAVTAAPTHFDRVSTDLLDFLPSTIGWSTSYMALHEWIGCAWYALRQGMLSSND